MDLPFEIEVYDKAFVRRGWLGEPMSLSATVRHNAAGSLSFVTRFGHPRFADLLADGARIVCRYKGEHLTSGFITRVKADSPTETAEFFVTDDFAVLAWMLGWPNPTGTIDQQGAETSYDRRTGPAESVVKAFATVNATRLGLPITAAPDLARGANVTVAMRMHPLTDRLFPAVDVAGIGVNVRQSGAGLVVDAYTPATFPLVITSASGILASWEFTRQIATASRVVVMGQGEGTARAFVYRIDAALEAAFGWKIEAARDARDVDDTAPDALAQLQARGDESLAEAAPMNGIAVQLAETGRFSYGQAFSVGDSVTIAGPGWEHTDVVREASFNYDVDSGLTVTPTVGDPDASNPLRLAFGAIAKLGQKIRDYDARS